MSLHTKTSQQENQVESKKKHHFSAKERFDYKLKLQEWALVQPMPISKSPLGTLLAFKPARAKVLNAILVLSRKHKLLYATQQTIGKMAGVHEDTAWREIQELTKLGYIGKYYRGANRTCWYKPSEWFNNKDVQSSLSKKLAIFFCFSLSLLKTGLLAGTGRTNIVFNIFIENSENHRKSTMPRNVESLLLSVISPPSVYGIPNSHILGETSELFRGHPPKELLPDSLLPDFMVPAVIESKHPSVSIHPTESEEQLMRYIQSGYSLLSVWTTVANPPWRSIDKLKDDIRGYEDKLAILKLNKKKNTESTESNNEYNKPTTTGNDNFRNTTRFI